jgi:hypothetical protein
MLAELFEQSRPDKRQEAAMRVLWLRDRIINASMRLKRILTPYSSEFGPSR